MVTAVGSLLASALAVTGLLDAGVRSEARGIKGNATDAAGNVTRLTDTVPYTLSPTLSLALDEPQRYTLRLGYASSLLFLARTGSTEVYDTAYFGTASLMGAWQPSSRSRLDFSGTFSQGTQQITPAAQLTTPGPAPGPAQPPSPVGTASSPEKTGYHGESASVTGNVGMTRYLAIGGGLSFGSGGATEKAGKQFFPPQENWVLEAHAVASPTPHDRLSLRAKYSRANIYSFGIGDIVDAGLRWERNLTPDVDSYVGAGVAATVRSSLAGESTGGGLAPTQERLTPVFEAGIASRPPLDRPGFGASLGVAYAPYVDPYTVSVQKRGTVKAGMTWQPLARWRFTGELAGQALIRDWRPRNGAGASELAAWYLQQRSDLGLAFRAGYTEVPRTDAVQATDGSLTRAAIPGMTFWEWSVSFVARWGWRREL
jgi:hypothetical protein